MARNKVDPCIFCGEAPCGCNKPAPKPKAKKPKPEGPIVERVGDRAAPAPMTGQAGAPDAATPPLKKSSFLSAMKDAAASAPPPLPTPKPPVRARVHQRQAVNEDEALFAAAVRALGPLLAPSEKEKYRVILTSTPTQEERLVVWKAQRRFEKEGGA